MQTKFMKGMDLSFVLEYEENGKCFYDMDGSKIDPFILAKNHGTNYVRLRIWNEPNNVMESGGYCSLSHTIKMAKRIKEAGMGFMLDFHYSDFWADPAQQNKPKAWLGYSVNKIAEAVYDYTYEVLTALLENDVFPNMIQIGNEIRSGMLFPEGAVEHWDNLALFINAGMKAVRDVDKKKNSQVVIHLDQGGRYYYLEEWFDQALLHGVVDFDVIALSYYPFWHGDYVEFKQTLEKMQAKYKKPIVIAEAAHAYRKTDKGFVGEEQERIAGFSLTPSGQKKALELIMNIVSTLPEENGLGVFYWEPFCFPDPEGGGWGENMGVLDVEGKALEGIEAFSYLPGDKCGQEIVRVYEKDMIYALKEKPIELPCTMRCLNWEGAAGEYPVVWDITPDVWKQSGNYRIDGIITGEMIHNQHQKIQTFIQLTILDKMEEGINLLPNGNFSEGYAGWEVEKSDVGVIAEIREELLNPFPAPPEPALYVKAANNFKLRINKEFKVSEAGYYEFSVLCRGDNTTGVKVELYVQTGEGNIKQEEVVNHVPYHELDIFLQNEKWLCYKMKKIYLQDGKINLGMKIDSPPIFMKIKDFKLIGKA